MNTYNDSLQGSPPLEETDLVISTQRLTKAFGNLVAVNDLNLQVKRGDIFGFLGPNGSGKTTTIRMLLGLIRPTAGRAILFDMDTAYQLPAILQHIGAIVETPTFYPYLSGIDNLQAVAAYSGLVPGENKARYEEVLDLVELGSYTRLAYRKYSLGMKQRLGIAAALLADPELVMLDEPTNGLDPAGVIEIRKLILRLAELGKTIFLSSHILSEVQQVCSRVAILRKGNLVRQGEVQDLLREKEQIEIRFQKGSETEDALALLKRLKEQNIDWITQAGIVTDTARQPTLVLDAPAAHSAEVNRILAQNDLFAAEIHPRTGSLEDVYLQATAAPVPGGNLSATTMSTTESKAAPTAEESEKGVAQ